jgi:hypothetical protein
VIREVFTQHDKDGSGAIEASEVANAMVGSPCPWSCIPSVNLPVLPSFVPTHPTLLRSHSMCKAAASGCREEEAPPSEGAVCRRTREGDGEESGAGAESEERQRERGPEKGRTRGHGAGEDQRHTGREPRLEGKEKRRGGSTETLMVFQCGAQKGSRCLVLLLTSCVQWCVGCQVSRCKPAVWHRCSADSCSSGDSCSSADSGDSWDSCESCKQSCQVAEGTASLAGMLL